MPNKSKIDVWKSEAILNYLLGHTVKGPRFTDAETRIFQDELMAMHRASSMNGGAIQYHKDRLDKQNYTWQGSCRNWIWESRETSLGSPPRWRMFVSKEGCAFELDCGLTKVQVRQAWDDYRRRTLLLRWPPGTRVLCYVNPEEPGSIVGPCPKRPDSYLVLLDGKTKPHSVQIGNIVEAK